MSTECNKSLAECEKKLAYYKEMYEMRTEAYLSIERQYEKLHSNFSYIYAENDRLHKEKTP